MRSRPRWNALRVIGLASVMWRGRARLCPETRVQAKDRAYKVGKHKNDRHASRLPRSLIRR